MAVRFCAMDERGSSIVASPPAEGGLISASVGAGGANLRNDVVAIQSLLNSVSSASGGPATPLKVDGIVGPLTIGAIRRFQSANHLAVVDGRIDPGGQTLTRLNVPVPRQSSFTGSSFRGTTSRGFALAATTSAGAKPTRMEAALAATPTAKLWTVAATVHLNGLLQGVDRIQRRHLPSLHIRHRKHTLSF